MSQGHDLSVAWAFDALDGMEQLAYGVHLEQCPTCRGDVEDIQVAAELLSEGVVLTPPAWLRSRVLAVTELAPEVASHPQAHAPEPEPAPVEHPGGEHRRRRWFGRRGDS